MITRVHINCQTKGTALKLGIEQWAYLAEEGNSLTDARRLQCIQQSCTNKEIAMYPR
jgi:hypothetical protein